ncbi:MAG: tyrosine-type recombinase/integrase [Candidatus Magasanikbacteria bacterium]
MDIQILARQFCDDSKYLKGYSPMTLRRYRQVIGFFGRFAGIEDVSQITHNKVKELFIHGRTVRKWSANTFICYHKTLAVFFRWCIKEGHMQANFTDDIEIPKLEKRLPPKLTKQDAMRLLEVAYNYPYDYHFLRYRNHAIFATFLFAGLRKKELLQLKLADVDLENLTIYVRQGKGSKDRIIPMSYRLADILNRYMKERRRLNKTCPGFFASLNHNQGLTEISLKRLVDKMRVASEIEFTIHKLRHTFATLMLEGGCDIFSLSKMMGHSDIKTTTIYLAASAEHLRAQIVKHPLNNI